MSKLSELLAALCPDGVEYRYLWEMTIWDKKFNAVDKSKQKKVLTYPYLLAKDLFSLEVKNGTVFLLSTGEKTGWTTEEIAGNNICEGEVVTLPWGKSRPVVDCIKYYKGKFVTADNRIATSSNANILSNKFLYYWMLAQGKNIDRLYRGSGIKHPNMSKVLNMKIPVPPLEVQAEIVRILDNFAELTNELTEKLNAELVARKKQYEYYRDLLLTFDDAECPLGGGNDSREKAVAVRWMKLGEEFPFIRNGFVGTVTPYFTDKEHGVRYLKGTNIHNGVISDNDISYVNKDFNQKHCKSILKADDILVVQSGHVGECAVVGEQYEGANCHALIVMSNGGNCDSRYIVYYLQSREGKRRLERITTGGTVKHILASQIKDVVVPVPPLSEQRRIVSILDRFDALCHDVCEGLPAEIAARRKQYEYYRDKLLTFEEKTA